MLSNFTYGFTDINPVDDKDGGEPGGNIRVAYLYNPAVLRLRSPNPGSSTDANAVFPGPELKYNPGRIDPLNTAWTASRKPLVAAWETLDGENKFFTVNVHFGSKGGGSSIEGDARPPVNGGVYDRLAQANATAVSGSFLSRNKQPNIISSPSSRLSSKKTVTPVSLPAATSTNSLSLPLSRPSEMFRSSKISMML